MGALLALVAAAAFAGGPVALGLRLGMPVRVSLAAVPPVAGVWWIGHALADRDWHDIDGWVDCYGYCNAWHAVGATWFLAPPLAMVVLLLVAGGIAVGRIVRGRRDG